MHTRNLIGLLAGSLLLAGNALADRPGSDWISIDDALSKAREAGYTELHKIEADNDGYWEGEGLKQDGRLYEFRIDGKSGEVTRDQLED
ncbi:MULTISPECIES: PepSY domain-containing protein [unclassified Pseudomonas]|uniref:PepSY domain-containing protein n=1 Tax=unclassified Pseudomonas TaxID=196821 RepID=UPI000EE3E4AA|nr:MULTISPECIES: PepSY domain-containing protein [Pseudomonas]MBH3339029.1 PepSY domain-containing protein [Pseudomonas mendocina]HBZ92417.1 PepSY domain-containing protein [Pseudomonas sp.]